MKQLILAACLSLIFVPFSSCKKSSGKSRTEILAESSWKFDNAGLDMDRNGTVDSPLPPGFLQPCDTDNTITFESDGTGMVDEGPSKCNGSAPQTSSFTWSFKDNEEIITFTNFAFGGLNGDVKVKTINNSQLELHKEVNVGMIVNVIVYMKR